MIDFTSFGKLIPDSVQLHYSLSRTSVQLPYSLNSYRSLYPQQSEATKKQADVLELQLQVAGNVTEAIILRTRWTIESNSVVQQNLIGYLIANLKPKLREERASQIHIPSWKLHFVSHLCS